MRYSVSVDVPNLEEGLRFYRDALRLTEIARPIATYAILKCGEAQIGIMEKPAGTKPAMAAMTFAAMSATGRPCISISMSTALRPP